MLLSQVTFAESSYFDSFFRRFDLALEEMQKRGRRFITV